MCMWWAAAGQSQSTISGSMHATLRATCLLDWLFLTIQRRRSLLNCIEKHAKWFDERQNARAHTTRTELLSFPTISGFDYELALSIKLLSVSRRSFDFSIFSCPLMRMVNLRVHRSAMCNYQTKNYQISLMDLNTCIIIISNSLSGKYIKHVLIHCMMEDFVEKQISMLKFSKLIFDFIDRSAHGILQVFLMQIPAFINERDADDAINKFKCKWCVHPSHDDVSELKSPHTTADVSVWSYSTHSSKGVREKRLFMKLNSISVNFSFNAGFISLSSSWAFELMKRFIAASANLHHGPGWRAASSCYMLHAHRTEKRYIESTDRKMVNEFQSVPM